MKGLDVQNQIPLVHNKKISNISQYFPWRIQANMLDDIVDIFLHVIQH